MLVNVSFLITVLSFNGLIVLINKNKFGKSLPLTFMAMILMMYVSGILHSFNYAIILISLSNLMFLYSLFKEYKKNKFKELKNNYFTTSFYLFILLFIIVTILHYGRKFVFIDEFCHLGLMAKESYRLNELHLVTDSLMWYNKEYPPFYTLLEVMYCKFGGKFLESYCYQALTLFNLSLFLPLFEKWEIKKNNIFSLSLMFIGMLVVGLTINETRGMAYTTLFYNSIYLDLPIGLLFGYVIYLIYRFDNTMFDYIDLCVSLSCLVLTKQISIVFYILAIATFIFIKAILKKDLTRRNLILLIILIVIPLLFYKSWSFLVSFYNIDMKFDVSELNLFAIFKYIAGKTNEYETYIISRFIKNTVLGATIIKPINMSYAMICIVITIGLIVVAKIYKKKEIAIISCVFFVGAIGYAYALMLSYVYSFGPYEGPYLTMYDRYVSTYIFAGFVLMFMLVNDNQNLCIKNKVAIIVCCLLFTSVNTLRTCKPVLNSDGLLDKYNQRYVDYIKNFNNEKVLVISQNDPLARNILRYYTIDYDHNTTYLELKYAGDGYDVGVPMWEDEFAELLKDYDYLYICDYDDSFYHYKGYFSDDIQICHLYKIYWQNIYDVKLVDVTFN